MLQVSPVPFISSIVKFLFSCSQAIGVEILKIRVALLCVAFCLKQIRIAGGMVEFRRSLAASFLFRFFVEVSYALERDAPGFKAVLPPEYESAVRRFERPAPRGMQYFTKVEDGQVVGQPERHMAADLQARH